MVHPQRSSSHPPQMFSMAPKLVVRANTDYSARMAGELAFRKGDFFYVIHETATHYQVINPVQKTRGTVPKTMFDSLDKIQQDKQQNSVLVLKGMQVPNCVEKQGSFMYTIDCDYGQRHHVLFRSYSDFWVLHVSLLNHFPVESGRSPDSTDNGRIIPFLAPPSATSSLASAATLTTTLQKYLNCLLEPDLAHILSSSIIKRFIMCRAGDVDTKVALAFGMDDEAALFDLLGEYAQEEETTVCITIMHSPKAGDATVWSDAPNDVRYSELVEFIENELGVPVPRVMYKDETGASVLLVGDADLDLLVKTRANELVFYY